MLLESQTLQIIFIDFNSSSKFEHLSNYRVQIINKNKTKASYIFDQLFECQSEEDYIRMKQKVPFYYRNLRESVSDD